MFSGLPAYYCSSQGCIPWIPVTKQAYTNLLTSGKLNGYLADIDEQSREMLFRLIKQIAEREGVTEQLKAENVLEWTGRMNNIRACAMELVNEKIICN